MNRLEIAWNIYNKVIDEFVLEMFDKNIKPWLIRNKLNFLSGNGTFYIYKLYKGKREEYNIDNVPCKIPKDILYILNMEIPGYSHNTLGTLMPNLRYFQYIHKTEVKMYL